MVAGDVAATEGVIEGDKAPPVRRLPQISKRRLEGFSE